MNSVTEHERPSMTAAIAHLEFQATTAAKQAAERRSQRDSYQGYVNAFEAQAMILDGQAAEYRHAIEILEAPR